MLIYRTVFLLIFLQGVPDEHIEEKLKSEEGTPLHIVAFQSDREELTGIYLLGDSVYIRVDVKGAIIAAVMKLMASYYVFNIDYPRQYSMLMGLFQSEITKCAEVSSRFQINFFLLLLGNPSAVKCCHWQYLKMVWNIIFISSWCISYYCTKILPYKTLFLFHLPVVLIHTV